MYICVSTLGLPHREVTLYPKVGWLDFMAYQTFVGLFNAKSIFIQIITSISNNSV